MIITKKILADNILDYLHHRISLSELVDWSENILMDGEFDEDDFELLKEFTGRLGLADVRAFGLMWEDCENYFKQLGYKVNIKAEAI